MKEIREIKFRHWDTFNEVMNYCVDMYVDYLSKFFIEYNSAIQGGNDCYLMQFIGFKDKEGKEIYESDIVEIRHFGKLEKVVIVFHNGMFCFKWKDGYINSYQINKENCKVIGNIFENKELL